MNKNLLLVDIGNTSAHFALYKGGRFLKEFRVRTPQLKNLASSAIKKNVPSSFQPTVLIASVVPDAATLLKRICQKELHFKTWQIGKEIPVPITNRYKNPQQVGVDRLLNAFAGYQKYKKALILIDFGTAITFDVVSAKGEYLGGVIAPGIEISLEALYSRTAMLPKLQGLRHPKTAIGRDTAESITIGCAIGIGGLCDRIVEAIQKQSGSKSFVVATGGYASFMKKYCHLIRVIEPKLVLDGIRQVYYQASL